MIEPTLPAMTPVQNSTNITATGHDGTHGYIQFKSGGTYKYKDAPAKVFDGFKTAESPGGYFRAAVAGKYPHEKLPQ